jgi:sulfonate transport system substrate-binding protein
MKRRDVLKSLAAGAVASFLFSPARSQAALPKVIRFASPDLSAGQKPSYGGQVDVLNTRRLFEKEFAKDGVKIEWHFFKGAGPAINEAIANRQIDFAFLGDLPPIIGRASGLDTRLLLALTRGVTSYLAVTPESGIRTLADLRGKRVGIFRGTADQLGFARVLERAGLSERDIRLINLDFNAVNAALVAKQIDATWAPNRVLALRDRGVVRIVLSSNDLDGVGSGQGAFIGVQSFLAQYPQAARRVVKTVVTASHWLSQEENREAYAQLVADLSSYPRKAIEESLRDANLNFHFSPLLDKYFIDNFRTNIELAKRFGLIRRTFDIEPWIERSFLDAALDELGFRQVWQPHDKFVGKTAATTISQSQ